MLGQGGFDEAALSLQWGRGLKTPEMTEDMHYEIRRYWLQWGRGLKTPEIRMRMFRRSGHRARFNGAGVLRPRKFPKPRYRRRKAAALQWGRGLKTPEMGLVSKEATMTEEASMGPGS